jgi:hypothetical protein
MPILERKFGFIFGLIVTILLSAVLELSGMWWTMIIAGFVGGFLVKRAVKGFAVGLVGVLIGWALYFVAFWIIAPSSASVAFSEAPLFVGLALVLGGTLGALSGTAGALASALMLSQAKEPEKKPSTT